MNKTSKNTKGFTLSEVLITLGIVGIIASMTIPALIKKTSDKETVTELNNIYSTLSAATNKIVNDEGPISGWNWDEFGSASFKIDEIVANYKKQLVFTKSCAFTLLQTTACFDPYIWKPLTGNNLNSGLYLGNGYYNILLDGTIIKFEKVLSTGPEFGNGPIKANETPKMEIWVDLNGMKAPNKMGRDLFLFMLTPEKGLIAPDNNVNGYCTTGQFGFTCATRILQEGAVNY